MVRKTTEEPKQTAPTPKPATTAPTNIGQPTPLAATGSTGLAKPATYKLNIDNKSYFVEVEQIG